MYGPECLGRRGARACATAAVLALSLVALGPASAAPGDGPKPAKDGLVRKRVKSGPKTTPDGAMKVRPVPPRGAQRQLAPPQGLLKRRARQLDATRGPAPVLVEGPDFARSLRSKRERARARRRFERFVRPDGSLPPELLAQQKRYAREAARLARLREVAEAKGDTEAVARVDALAAKAKARIEAYVGTLEGETP